MQFDFTDKVMILTGANGGIGRSLAELYAKAGGALVLADRDVGALEEFAASIQGAGRIDCIGLDAADPASSQALVDFTVGIHGKIDHVVPAAGIYLVEPFAEMTDDAWRRTLSINLDGVFYLLRRCVPHFSANSAVVNLTSLAGHRGAYTNAHYSASKGALTSLTRSLCRELAPHTRVNAVAPGIIATPMTADLITNRGDATLSQTPLARFGTPLEIASVIAFLCSDAASFISGETIQVNGGLYMA